MKPLAVLSLFLFAAPAGASAPPADCARLLESSRGEQVAVPEGQAPRRVAGNGRLYFHAAPHRSCRQPGLFVVPGDRLLAIQEYGTFTEVRYVHPRTGRVTEGWVDSGRLAETRLP